MPSPTTIRLRVLRGAYASTLALGLLCSLTVACGGAHPAIGRATDALARAQTAEDRLNFDAALQERQIARDAVRAAAAESPGTALAEQVESRSLVLGTTTLAALEDDLLPRAELGRDAEKDPFATAVWLALQLEPRQRSSLLRRLAATGSEPQTDRAVRWTAAKQRGDAWADVAEKRKGTASGEAWDRARAASKHAGITAQKALKARLMTLAPRAGRIPALTEWITSDGAVGARELLELGRLLATTGQQERAQQVMDQAVDLARSAGDVDTLALLADVFATHGATDAGATIFDEIGLDLRRRESVAAMARALARAGDLARLDKLLAGFTDAKLISGALLALAEVAPPSVSLRPMLKRAHSVGAGGGDAQAALVLATIEREVQCRPTADDSADAPPCNLGATVDALMPYIVPRRARMTTWIALGARDPKYYGYAEADARALFTDTEKMKGLMRLALTEAKRGRVDDAMAHLALAQRIAQSGADAGIRAERYADLYTAAHAAAQASVATSMYNAAVQHARQDADPLRAAELLTRLALARKPVDGALADDVFSRLPKLREGPRALLLSRWAPHATAPALRARWSTLVDTVQQPDRAKNLAFARVRLDTTAAGLTAGLASAGSDATLIVEAIRHAGAQDASTAFERIPTLADAYDRAQCVATLVRHRWIPDTTLLQRIMAAGRPPQPPVP